MSHSGKPGTRSKDFGTSIDFPVVVRHFYNDIDSWELYDLQKDPAQMHNIYGQPGTEKLTGKLKKQLQNLQVKYDDPIRNTANGVK